MNKFLVALSILIGSLGAYAFDDPTYSDNYSSDETSIRQSATTSRENTLDNTTNENKLEGTFPEVKSVEPGKERWSAGILTGINSPTGDNVSASPEFGIDVSFQPIVPFGFGFEATTSRLDDASDVQRTAIFPKATYNFGGDVPVLKDSYIGAGAGPVFVGDNVEWGAAPMLGFDIPISKKAHDFISLGANAKYQFITGTANSFASALALKYWF